MIRKLFVLLGRRFRGNVFDIDPDVPLSALIEMIGTRIMAVLRGHLLRPFLARGSGSTIFIGRGVKLKHPGHIMLAKGVTLGEAVKIRGLSRKGIRLAAGASIGSSTIIVATSVLRSIGEGCSIGNNSSLGQNCFVGCGAGVFIGNDVIGGQFISFHSENHNFQDLDMPIRLQGVTRAAIVIEDDCWLGAKTTFLSGCRVGKGSVVAAGAVVRGEIAPYSIIGGVPARVIGSRLPKDANIALSEPS